jgi:heat shock protein HslJ
VVALLLAGSALACDVASRGGAEPAAVVSTATAGDDVFGGLIWRLQSQRDADGAVQEVEGRITLRFLDGRLTGFTGCNALDASYALDARRSPRLTIETGSVTLRACEPTRLAQEQLLLANLERVARVRVNASQLVLSDAGGTEVLTFEAEAPLALHGVTWQLTDVANGRGGVEQVSDVGPVLLRVSDDGGLQLTTPCHDLQATLDREADALTVGALRATATRGCGERDRQHDARVRAALAATVRYAIEEERLMLRTETGALSARFEVAR